MQMRASDRDPFGRQPAPVTKDAMPPLHRRHKRTQSTENDQSIPRGGFRYRFWNWTDLSLSFVPGKKRRLQPEDRDFI